MFRKIVSNITFSPALVGQLGFYAKRLRHEEATRRLGLIFVALALVVQALAVFQPPESANASNQNDFVSGGLGLGANKSLNNFLRPYDTNVNHLRDVMNYTGITRAEIAAASYTSFAPGKNLSWGYQSRFSAAQGEKIVRITGPTGNAITTVYARPMTLYGYTSASRIYGWVGHSAKMGWFAVMQECGNLVTTRIPAVPVVTKPKPIPVVPKPTPIPVTPKPTPTPVVTIEKIMQSKSAINSTQGSVDATTVVAQASDRIEYTITAKNSGNAVATVKLEEQLADVLEYSTLIDNGAGTFNDSTKTLVWPDAQLAPNATATRTFAVQVLATIPSTAQGSSDPSSYNCIMTNVFGNDVTINVSCATPKVIEQVVTELPTTGPTENLIFAGFILSIATYFYARARQVKKEVRLIRKNLNSGTI